jgi:hypothetical protein
VSVWHTASDDAGRVQVGIDATGLNVQVAVAAAWRRSGSAEALAAATLAAYAAAGLARLASGASEPPPIAPTSQVVERPSESASAARALLHRAFRDLDEFRRQLVRLNTVESTVTDPAGLVTVTLRGAQVVGLDVERQWFRSADDADVGQRLGAALTAAVRAGRAVPHRALDGCPDLVAVLTRSSIPLPFVLDPVSGAPR